VLNSAVQIGDATAPGTAVCLRVRKGHDDDDEAPSKCTMAYGYIFLHRQHSFERISLLIGAETTQQSILTLTPLPTASSIGIGNKLPPSATALCFCLPPIPHSSSLSALSLFIHRSSKERDERTMTASSSTAVYHQQQQQQARLCDDNDAEMGGANEGTPLFGEPSSFRDSYGGGELGGDHSASQRPPQVQSWHSTGTTATGRRKKRRGGRSATVVGSCLAVALLLLVGLSGTDVATFPTRDELELAQRYGVDGGGLFRGGIARLRRAQRLADGSRAAYLGAAVSPDSAAASAVLLPASVRETRMTSGLDRAVQKITEGEHGKAAEHYVEPPEGCEATVVIVRHCEKGSVREHCAQIGYERSVYLATLFGDDHERWPAPSYVFAQSPGARNNKRKLNFREIETVGPVAEKFGLDIDDSYSDKNINGLARQLLTFLQTGKMCGKVTLISWKHSNIGHLANHLGCGPSQGCPIDYSGRSFDDTWHLKYVYDRPDHSSRKSLKLPRDPEWRVFGSVQREGFDPLAFSKTAGDYPSGGTSHGSRWKKAEVDYPERKSTSDKSVWKESRVGFH